MPNLTRRSLFVLGGTGAAGLAVAGCGTEDDPRADASNGEILNAAAAAEAALGATYSTEGTKPLPEIVEFEKASSARQQTLDQLGANSSENGTGDQTLPAAIAAANAAIAAYRQCVRLGPTTELRSTAIKFLTQVAAEQAVLRGLNDEDQSPSPFVTGGADKPYVASEDDDDNDTTSSTTSTTSSSTTTTSTAGNGE